MGKGEAWTRIRWPRPRARWASVRGANTIISSSFASFVVICCTTPYISFYIIPTCSTLPIIVTHNISDNFLCGTPITSSASVVESSAAG
ncbi:conserved hypothetical protein [Ricinus communis]|uniref:Uncharacterized protein n=1 Tax=Ricinus communis TaxID=3988 RepID=B9S5A2_RICCO|nr:conserved hypothetical protein [Ricinus communis]